jgi:hypothetical protein
MTRYVVILQASLHGSPAHTTHDAIEAESCEEAEEKALAGWREAEPRYTYGPLLTLQN